MSDVNMARTVPQKVVPPHMDYIPRNPMGLELHQL